MFTKAFHIYSLVLLNHHNSLLVKESVRIFWSHMMFNVSASIWGNFQFQSFTQGWIWTYGVQNISLWTKTVGIGLQHEWVLTWGYTNDAMPEAYWQVWGRGARPELQVADAYCWQILTSSEAWPCVDVLVITMYCLLTCWVCQAYSEVWGPHTMTLLSGLTD